MHGEDPLPHRPRLFDEKVILADKSGNVGALLRLILTELRKLHFTWAKDATTVEANRLPSLSTAAGSSGTNSLECCDSSNTSLKVMRSVWKRTLPVWVSLTFTRKSIRMVYADPRPSVLRMIGTAL